MSIRRLSIRGGQRAVRFYDPDRHIVEVGENMATVCRRFCGAGLTAEEIAEKMGVPSKYVSKILQGGGKHGLH